jgi:hypothetical protein
MLLKEGATVFFIEFDVDELRIKIDAGQSWFCTFSDNAADF